MLKSFEILDSRLTPLGEISLRRRKILSLGDKDVFEVKLGDEFLMSSLFHEVEVALADLGLKEVGGSELSITVGGLGLGYTALAALKCPRVKSLIVIEALQPVIDWHTQGLVPLGPALTADSRCRFVLGDFFALAESPTVGFDASAPGRRFDAILLDIDHSPTKVLHAENQRLYRPEGLKNLALHLKPGGVFALWSDDPPDHDFVQNLQKIFEKCESHIVRFHNPLLRSDSQSTVYVAKAPNS